MFRNLSSIRKIRGFFANRGLRKKILLHMITLLLLLGFTMALVTHTILLRVLKTEFQQKGVSSARSIAANSLVDVLTQNTSRLKKLVKDEKRLDAAIAYIFIIDSSSNILAHTFSQGFPLNLAKANNLEAGKGFSIETLDTQLGFIYDIVVPIVSEESLLGQVRLGILKGSIQRTINAINLILVGITLLIVTIGVILAYRVSSLITEPISKLVEATQSIRRGNFSTHIDVKTKDEIGFLGSAFNEMASRLKEKIEEINRLNIIEERNRIALDLHDGCAQELASIIKRLELCEKLFKIDPAKAVEELNILKENTKNILNKTRQVIFDLKLPEDADFSLLDNIDNYIKSYQKRNDISIKLDILGSIGAIPSDKSKQIFYIIGEALTNTKKHSLAKNVELRLECNDNDGLSIDIKDDGNGFDINTIESSGSSCGRWGLISMQQRAASLGGTLVIKSKPNHGTEVRVNIPLKEKVV